MQIIDVVTYNGEADLLEIRLNILKDYVDQFIICEAPTTFSGKPKPIYFERFLRGIKFGRYNINADTLNKIKFHLIDENYTPEEIALAESSPNTIGAAHWKHEFLQKESIKKALTHLKDDDVVFIGDCDEIWQPSCAYLVVHPLDNFKLPMIVYTYYLNNCSSEEWWGTHVSTYGFLKNRCLNELRSTNHRKFEIWSGGINNGTKLGWHFTSMGGYEEVRRKLEASYTLESYWTPETQANLKENIEQRKDFLGRPFTFTLDESDLPQYLKDNKEKYAHLFA